MEGLPAAGEIKRSGGGREAVVQSEGNGILRPTTGFSDTQIFPTVVGRGRV
jgi:hypothetical protein